MTVTIEPLDCGTLTAPLSMFEAGAEDTPSTIPVPSWLIRHPDGLVVIDCGMSSQLTSPGDYLDVVSLFFTPGVDSGRLVDGALAGREVDAAEVDIVVLSHLHFDHAGGLALVPNARVVVQTDEWVAGADDEMTAANSFNPADYALGHDVVTVDGEHDLFGDGLVTCIPTPGHTPGHQSVRIRLADSEIVICGDCADFERTIDGAPLPPSGFDLDLQRTSIERLRDLRSGGARLIPGHDPDVIGALPNRLT